MTWSELQRQSMQSYFSWTIIIYCMMIILYFAPYSVCLVIVPVHKGELH